MRSTVKLFTWGLKEARCWAISYHGSLSILFLYSFYTLSVLYGLFLNPVKASENIGFLMFSGGLERDQWHEMG